MHALKTIVIDLTPILPGGENGGAKIFAITLVRELALLAQETQFILLTQKAAHDEMAHLDAPNVRRLLVPGIGAIQREQGWGRYLHRCRAAVFRRIPSRLARLVSKVTARLVKRVFVHSPVAGLRADLLFCPFTAPTMYEPGMPTVTTIHDVQYMVYPQFFAAEDAANRDLAIRSALRYSTAIATISDHVRATVARSATDPARVRTVYHRMAQRLVRKDDPVDEAAALAPFGLHADGYLIYPANFWRHKNHEMLLAAFALARHEGLPDAIRLVCTGASDPRREEMRELARRMGLGDHVVFPGYLTDETFAVLLGRARGLIFPSLFEGFGLPVVEAMALGVPVACSNVTSLPEIADDAALLFDPRVPTDIARAIHRLAIDEPTRRMLKTAGVERAALFSDSGAMARDYWALFEFAMARVGEQHRFHGVHADGWAGGELTLEMARDDRVEAIEIDIWAPSWLPHGSSLVSAILPDGSLLETWPLLRGERRSLSFRPPDGVRSVRLRMEPSFVPAKLGGSHDHRELSIMVSRCELVLAQGARHRLYPDPTG